MKSRACGFTLMELIIVIAILAILGSLAITEYQRYLVRTQFIEGMELAGGFKSSVLEWISDDGSCPTDSDTAYLGAGGTQGRYVNKVSFGGTLSASGGCTITATFKSDEINPALAGSRVSLRLTSSGGSAAWECRSNVAAAYLPKSCSTE